MESKAKKRILIVDDAIVVRRKLSDAFASDGDLEVVGTAGNGRIALAKFDTLKPDVVLLDIEMPEMDGLETIRELRKIDARVPIIMCSTLTKRGAGATLEALSLGATDYVTKPSNLGSGSAWDEVMGELIPRVRALCHLPDLSIQSSMVSSLPRLDAGGLRSHLPLRLIAIGCSTGGPDALARIIPLLPPDLSVPIVIAQHMPPIFTTMLAARLSSKSALPVRECAAAEPLNAGCALLAPGDYHLMVSGEEGRLLARTHQAPRENFCRPSVDVLFRSVAETCGSRALAVVLTGMGQDGLKGCELLHRAGSRILVQDEASSVVWGMPGLVARAGLAEKALPLDQIAAEISSAANAKLFSRHALSARFSV